MKNLILIVFVFYTVTLIGGTQVNQCSDSTAPLPTHFELKGCEKPTCIIHTGENLEMKINFTAPHYISGIHAKAKAWVRYLFIWIDRMLNLGDMENACNYLSNTQCPVAPEQEIQYSLKVFVEDSFPKNKLIQVDFSIEDDNENPLVCVSVPLIIV